MSNIIRNRWHHGDGTRTVTVTIETTRPAGTAEFELMARLTDVVEVTWLERETT